jgi:hypothetical protein
MDELNEPSAYEWYTPHSELYVLYTRLQTVWQLYLVYLDISRPPLWSSGQS